MILFKCEASVSCGLSKNSKFHRRFILVENLHFHNSILHLENKYKYSSLNPNLLIIYLNDSKN